jgi:phospholipid/cholesterol/gamma-HCH transport system substrate-binding protein
METRANYVLVGGFVLALVVLAFAFIIWLANVDFQRTEKSYYLLFDESVSGLSVGGTVSYRGIRVGRITDIAINPDNVEQVRVDLAIDSAVPIKADAVASQQFQGITGLAYIEITGGTQAAPELPEDSEITTRPTGLQEVIQNAPELLNQLILAVDRFNTLLAAENQAAFARMLENMASVSEALANEDTGVPRLMRAITSAAEQFEAISATISTDLPVMIDHVDTAILDASAVLASVDAEIRPAANSLSAMAQSLGQTSDTVRAILAENRDDLRDFVGTGLVELSQTISEVRTVIGQLARIVTELERAPSRFFFGDSTEGYEFR